MGIKVDKKLIFFLGALGGLLYGYDMGVISGALLFIKDDIPLNSVTEGLVVASMLVGAIFGSGASGPLSDRLGRRRVVFVIAIVYIVGALILALAPSMPVLVIGRLVIGLAVGGSTAIVPVYLSEMAPTEQRGSLSSLNQLMITIGILSSYLINYAFTPIEGWRWMLGLAVVPSLILLIGVAFMPESPRWLLEHRSEKAARDVMKLTFKDSEIDKEIADMKEINSISESTWNVLKSPWLRPTLIIGCIFALLQQIIGINAIIYYAPSIFSKAGLGDATSILGTVGIGTVNVIITIVAIMIIDKIDRKRLLVIGNIGMVASLLIMAVLIWTIGIQSSAWIIVACLTLFIIFFGFTWGPVLWVMLPELFPMRARGAATGAAALVLSIGSLLVAQFFPILTEVLPVEQVFLIFAVIGVCALIFVIKYLPETRGRSLEEIEADLRSRTNATDANIHESK
ncbi:glucose transporter GlcP [Staphylococcus saprophyticus]|jgi:sugar porter (SP) family MFS transporter|uniref:glucose transporter GlcP n=1 Tax=Staphylococcus saprophyticus TaxID=29385 RepID=UPI0016431C5F|nr:sugar porter family MFS transporter [Staphylococcus saprophyticus]MBC2919846.1 sugar porter family MFS transporter [Staphylococcus saprophyticus]MBC2957134.1 sugar porter family MFS transporter [Staphylococcus saprophyticus]MBC3008744.1 sugar porter family MFS transporter [Staphylococcus saprophyticus]MBC3022165.1 sugar porter family MFS transporter [Staphylococcus saprophyticus]MBC3030118.1 sugar porter family MFS transporter [Staphylococcus saprophyticus]